MRRLTLRRCRGLFGSLFGFVLVTVGPVHGAEPFVAAHSAIGSPVTIELAADDAFGKLY